MADVRFESMKNGYNRYQVDDKIEQLMNEITSLQKKVELYSSRLEEVEKIAKEYKDKYQNLASEIHIREKAAEDIARISLKEANVIVATAQKNADIIIQEALTSAKMILIEVSKLGEETGEIKGRMMEQLSDLNKALQNFEIPPLPDVNLLDDKEMQ